MFVDTSSERIFQYSSFLFFTDDEQSKSNSTPMTEFSPEPFNAWKASKWKCVFFSLSLSSLLRRKKQQQKAFDWMRTGVQPEWPRESSSIILPPIVAASSCSTGSILSRKRAFFFPPMSFQSSMIFVKSRCSFFFFQDERVEHVRPDERRRDARGSAFLVAEPAVRRLPGEIDRNQLRRTDLRAVQR